ESWFQRASYKEAAAEFRSLLSSYPGSSSRALAQFRVGEILLRANNPADSRRELEKILADASMSPEFKSKALYMIAESHYQQKNYRLALKYYKRIIEDFARAPEAPQARLGLAWCSLGERDYQAARAAFSSFAAKYPRHASTADAVYLAAVCVYLDGNRDHTLWAAATSAFAGFIKTYPRSQHAAAAYYYTGHARFNAADYPSAAEIFKSFAKKYPSSGLKEFADFMAAECLFKTAEYDLARKNYSEFVERYPSSGLADDAYYKIALCYSKRMDMALAASVLEDVAAKFPSTETALNARMALAEVLFAQGKKTEAFAALKDASSRHRSVAAGFLIASQTASLYAKAGDWQNAATFYEFALSSASAPTEAREDTALAYSVCLVNLSRREDARKTLAQISLSERSVMRAEAMFRLAEADYDERDSASATSRYEKIIADYPSSRPAPHAMFRLGDIARGRGDRAKAYEIWAELVQKYPYSPVGAQTMCEVAQYLRENKKYDKALAVYSKIESAYAYTDIARSAALASAGIHRDAGNSGLAVEKYEKIIAASPSVPVMAEAAFALAEIKADRSDGAAGSSLSKKSRVASEFLKVAADYPDTDFAATATMRAAEIYGIAGERALAEEMKGRLLARYPSSEPSARIAVEAARVKMDSRDYRAAVDVLGPAASGRSEQSAIAQKMIGDCYFLMSRYSEAVVEYLKTAYLFRNYEAVASEAQFLAAKSLELKKDRREAVNAYRRTVNFFPGTLWAAEADVRIKELAK
ncbi:MAG: tetratricopeptide repeat protein, partial [Endomicrobiia bacterium]|nr:tetratricopeptide repeat protein [Endomicrobiia bacterium]